MEGDGEPVVQCRRYPPTVIVLDGGPAMTYPQVEEGDWCGEFLPAKRPAPRVVIHGPAKS